MSLSSKGCYTYQHPKSGLKFIHRNDPAKFKEDLLNIAKTTISSKILTQYKQMFAELAVNAVLRLKGSGNLDAIQIIKKLGGGLQDSYLDEGKGYVAMLVRDYLRHCVVSLSKTLYP